MRAPMLLGIALLVIGGTMFLRGLGAPRAILKVGDVSVRAEERSPAVPWVIGFCMLAGAALVFSETRRKA